MQQLVKGTGKIGGINHLESDTFTKCFFSIIIKVCIHHTVNNVNNSKSKCSCPTYCAQNKGLLVIFWCYGCYMHCPRLTQIVCTSAILINFIDVQHKGPFVRTPVSANPGLNFKPGFFFFLSNALSRIIFSIFFSISNHQIVGKENSTELAF